jgi:hypothetical protein
VCFTGSSLIRQQGFYQRDNVRGKLSMDTGNMAGGKRGHAANPGIIVLDELQEAQPLLSRRSRC